ncbi:hypothetical protein AB0J52_03275 [Spirillospora sp. NPDC049652]
MMHHSPYHPTARTLLDDISGAEGRPPVRNDFLARLREDRVTEEDLRRLIHVESHASAAEISAYALMGLRHPDELFQALGEMAHQARPKVIECARAMGMDDEHLAQVPAGAEALAYPAFLSWVALRADRAAIGAAVHVDLDRYYADSSRVAEALRATSLRVPGELVDYYSPSGLPGDLCDAALAFLQKGLDAGDDPVRAQRVGRLMEENLSRFWRSALSE